VITTLLLLGLLLAVAMSGLVSGWETGVYCLDRLRCASPASSATRPLCAWKPSCAGPRTL